MFKKDEMPTGSEATSAASQPRKPAAPPQRGSGPASIGPSITVKGDISGNEDLVIQGRVEGSVNLVQNNVTIGSNGRVKADVNGRTVIVEGEVKGDLNAEEQIILRHTARVEGGLVAPRVALEDGAVFRGSIEMDSKPSSSTGSKPAAAKKEPAPSDRGNAPQPGAEKKAESKVSV
jgi:cytoskeletal protein CcmA (bactofilin family)